MGKQPQPQRTRVSEALIGLALALGIVPIEFVTMVCVGGWLGQSASTVFWAFLVVGTLYFGALFRISLRRHRRAMLPGLVAGAALWTLLAFALYQLVRI